MSAQPQVRRERVYWVDVLCVMAVIRLAFLRARDRDANSPGVRYIRSTPMGLRAFGLVALLWRGFGASLRTTKLEYDVYDFRLPSGDDSAWDIDREVDTVQERVSSKVVAALDVPSLVKSRLKRPYAANKVQLFLRTSVGYEIYDVVLALSVFHRLARSEGESRSNVFLVERSPFTGVIMQEHHAARENAVETYASLRGALLLVRMAGGLSKQLAGASLRFPWRFGTHAGRVEQEGLDGPAAKVVRTRIAVGYTQGVDLETRSDIFWYPESGLSPDQVLVYFSRQRFPGSAKAIEQIDHLGLDWMDLSEWRPGREDSTHLRSLVGALGIALRLTVSAALNRPWSGWWYRRMLVDLERRVSFWSAFLREHNVAAHMHPMANTPNAIPMTFAAERAGALDIGYQWSASEFTLAARGRVVSSHVFFSWGSLFAGQMRSNGMVPDTSLLAGSIFGYLAKARSSEADRVRQELLRNGCDYIVCVFDSGFNRDIYQTPKMMAEFYETIVTWVLGQPGVCLLVKPKASVYTELAGAGSLLEQAVAAGSCVVGDPGQSSFEAAMSADIAIGIGINTAVFDAAVAGVPAVHFDLPGMAKGYEGLEAAKDEFVFGDAARLFQAVEAHRDSDGNTALGDHREWLDSVDPFRDGEAAQRIGAYLRWYMESIEAGLQSQQALADANERYSREVGSQYVMDDSDQTVTVGAAGLR